MQRSNRLKIIIEGPLALALLWESQRTGEPAQEIARRLLESAATPITSEWRLSARGAVLDGGPSTAEVRAARMVLDKAYGPPSKKPRDTKKT